MKAVIIKCIFAGILALTGVLTRVFCKNKKIGKPDNQIEEVAERLIKDVSGIEIDLSPDTPDKDIDSNAALEELWDLVSVKKEVKK